MPSEMDILRECIAALCAAYPLPKAWWHRNNTGVARMRGSHVRMGLGSGSPDIVGCVNGLFIGVEVKRPGKWEEPDQLEWRAMHELCGGVYLCVHSAREAVDSVREALAEMKARAA